VHHRSDPLIRDASVAADPRPDPWAARTAVRSGIGPPVLAALVALVLAACSSAAAPSPSPSLAPAPGGTVTSSLFQPAVTATLPSGWELATDEASYLLLRPAGSETLGIHLFRDPQAASQDGSCPESPEPGVGTTSSELSAWIRELPGLSVSDPRLATVGGLRGTVLDLGIAKDWSASCPFANGLPTVPLIVAPGGIRWVMAGGERLRLYLLDVPSGGTVAIDVDDFVGDQIDTLIGESLSIIQSMSFATD
jgi:hypothetical protein